MDHSVHRITVYRIVSIALLIVLALLMLFPLYWIITGSVKGAKEINARVPSFFPVSPTTANYAKLFSKPAWTWLLNTVFICGMTMLLACLCGAMGGYALATEYCPNTTVKGVVVIPNGHPLSDYVNDPEYGPVIAEYLGTASDYNYCTLHRNGYTGGDTIDDGGYGYDGDLVSDAQQLLKTAYDFMSQLDASSTHYQNSQTAASNLQGLLNMGSASTADIANAMAQVTQAMAGF